MLGAHEDIASGALQAALTSVDLFLRDSDHTAAYKAAELAAVTPH
jgi:hypothetical protein